MATTKSFTSLGQSKKLAEFLPLESADMYYQYVLPKSDKIKHNPEIGNPINALEWYNKGYTTSGKDPITLDEYCVPCWSLAALRNLLPTAIKPNKDIYLFESHNTFDNSWVYRYYNEDDTSYLYCKNTNEVDACVEMIIKLHELNLL